MATIVKGGLVGPTQAQSITGAFQSLRGGMNDLQSFGNELQRRKEATRSHREQQKSDWLDEFHKELTVNYGGDITSLAQENIDKVYEYFLMTNNGNVEQAKAESARAFEGQLTPGQYNAKTGTDIMRGKLSEINVALQIEGLGPAETEALNAQAKLIEDEIAAQEEDWLSKQEVSAPWDTPTGDKYASAYGSIFGHDQNIGQGLSELKVGLSAAERRAQEALNPPAAAAASSALPSGYTGGGSPAPASMIPTPPPGSGYLGGGVAPTIPTLSRRPLDINAAGAAPVMPNQGQSSIPGMEQYDRAVGFQDPHHLAAVSPNEGFVNTFAMGQPGVAEQVEKWNNQFPNPAAALAPDSIPTMQSGSPSDDAEAVRYVDNLLAALERTQDPAIKAKIQAELDRVGYVAEAVQPIDPRIPEGTTLPPGYVSPPMTPEQIQQYFPDGNVPPHLMPQAPVQAAGYRPPYLGQPYKPVMAGGAPARMPIMQSGTMPAYGNTGAVAPAPAPAPPGDAYSRGNVSQVAAASSAATQAQDQERVARLAQGVSSGNMALDEIDPRYRDAVALVLDPPPEPSKYRDAEGNYIGPVANEGWELVPAGEATTSDWEIKLDDAGNPDIAYEGGKDYIWAKPRAEGGYSRAQRDDLGHQKRTEWPIPDPQPYVPVEPEEDTVVKTEDEILKEAITPDPPAEGEEPAPPMGKGEAAKARKWVSSRPVTGAFNRNVSANFMNAFYPEGMDKLDFMGDVYRAEELRQGNESLSQSAKRIGLEQDRVDIARSSQLEAIRQFNASYALDKDKFMADKDYNQAILGMKEAASQQDPEVLKGLMNLKKDFDGRLNQYIDESDGNVDKGTEEWIKYMQDTGQLSAYEDMTNGILKSLGLVGDFSLTDLPEGVKAPAYLKMMSSFLGPAGKILIEQYEEKATDAARAEDRTGIVDTTSTPRSTITTDTTADYLRAETEYGAY